MLSLSYIYISLSLYIYIYISLSYSTFIFNSLARSMHLLVFRLSFNFMMWSAGIAKSTVWKVFFFVIVVGYYLVWLSDRNKVIRWYLQISEEFVLLIILDSFSVMHLSSSRMVEIKFLAHFPVDHAANPVMANLIIFLCYVAAFAIIIIIKKNGHVRIEASESSRVSLAEKLYQTVSRRKWKLLTTRSVVKYFR